MYNEETAIIDKSDKNTNKKNCGDILLSSNSVRQYLNEVKQIPRLSDEEQTKLFYEYSVTKDSKIREKIISSNLMLVVSVAKDYIQRLKTNLVNDYLDIIQEGNKGLIVAVEKYDVTLGCKFSSYAVYWIKQAIGRCLMETNGKIRLPIGIIESYWKIQKYKTEVEKQTGRKIKSLDAALALGMKKERAEYVIEKGALSVESLDALVLNESGKARIDFIDNGEMTPESEVIKIETLKLINQIMIEKLTHKEYFVVCCKNGIVNDINTFPNKKTLEEVGKIIGVTRERVRQILNNAYKKIKKEYIAITSDNVEEKIKSIKK